MKYIEYIESRKNDPTALPAFLTAGNSYQNGTTLFYNIFSIDRITVVFKAPLLSYENYNIRGNSHLMNRIADYKVIFETLFDSFIELKFDTPSKAFQHRYQMKGGAYLEFGRKLKVVNRHKKELYVETFPGGMIVLEHDQEYKCETKDSIFGIRLEFNPAKDDLHQIKPVLKHFYETHCSDNPKYGIKTWDNWVKFNRVDIAQDYTCAVDPLLVHKKHTDCFRFFGTEKHGVETSYLGSPDSEGQIRIYNKKLEMEKQSKMSFDDSHIWRFEMQLKKPFMASESDVLYNVTHFDKLSVFDSGTEPEEYTLRWFMHDAARVGMITAFNGVPRQTKIRMLKKLEAQRHKVVNPSADYHQIKELWPKFLTAFEELFYAEN